MGNMFGGGSSGGTSVTQEFKPPSWTTGYWDGQSIQGPWSDYVAQGQQLAQRPYDPYTGQRIANLNGTQLAGLDATIGRAQYGAPDLNSARGQIKDTSEGLYLGTNPYLGAQSGLGQTAAGSYLTANPYLSADANNRVINDTATNMAQAHRLGTAAQTDAAFARQGAFGGSAYDQMVQQNASTLANSVGQMANQARLGQQGLQSQAYQAERGLMQNAGLAGVQDWQAERNNMMGAAPIAGQLAQDDWQSAAALTGAGDALRQHEQSLLNEALAEWTRSQQWPLANLDLFGNVLARASGNVAGGSSTTQTGQGYEASPLASLLGLGALGAGAYGAYNT